MAFGGTSGRSVERRREERERQRDEDRRQKELDRRKQEQDDKRREEEAERQREQMRREEARQEAQEREASYEKARERHQAFIEQLRVQKRAERVEGQQEQKRRDTLLASLRDANRQRRRAEESEQSQPERREKERPLTAKKDRQPEPQKSKGPAKTLQGQAKKTATTLKLKEEQGAASRVLGQPRKAREAVMQGSEERRAEAGRGQQDNKKRAEVAQRSRARSTEGQKTDRQAKEKRLLLRLRKREEAREADKAEEKGRQKAAARKETLRRAHLARRMDEAREALTEERRKEARDTTTVENEGERVLPSREKERPAPLHDPFATRFPSGLISGGLPWLLTYENRIATSAGDPIALRGVNMRIEGPEGEGVEGAALDIERYTRMVADALDWGVTIVRVGFDPRTALDPSKVRGIMETTDAVVEMAAARRCYTLLSPGAPTGPGGSAGAANDLTSDEMIALWQLLSEWYAAEPAVLFDLGLPPRGLPAVPAVASDPWAAWSGFLRSLVAEIRVRHPRSVCFVAGMGGGTDLSGFPVIGREQCPVPNLVYTACLYPRQADPWVHLKRLSRTHACFVTEWGGESADVTWGERMVLLLGGAAIGWTAASWTGTFPLTRSAAGRVYPTPLGVVVQRALSLATERAEASRLGRFRVLM
jgi:hypothetical protein